MILAVLFGILVLAAGYLIFGTPELSFSSEKGNIELQLDTDGEALLRGRSLGTGEIVLDDAALRSGGVIVPAGTGIEAIAGELFPAEQFRGPWNTNAESLPSDGGGIECYLRGLEHQRVVRIWVFELDEHSWLAVALEFRDAQGRVHTKVGTAGVSTNTSFIKKHDFHWKTAKVRMTEGEFPG
jgi:hypothetical protein